MTLVVASGGAADLGPAEPSLGNAHFHVHDHGDGQPPVLVAEGLAAVELEVDPKNPTDPMKIYSRAGFAVTAELTDYQLLEGAAQRSF